MKRRTAKHVVGQLDTLVHRNVVLDLHAIANLDVGGNIHVLAQTAVATNLRATLHVTEVPDLSPLANFGALIDIRAFVHEHAVH